MNLRDRAVVDVAAQLAQVGAGHRRLGLHVGRFVDERSTRAARLAASSSSGVPGREVIVTKISPRSTGGMYSKPTSPSGISGSARTRLTKRETTRPARDVRSPHVQRVVARTSARTRSNPSPKRSTIRHGCHVESSAQRPASDGVTVNDTNSDVSVATVTTRPNSRKNSPTEPGKNEIGKKTTTSTSVMTIAATPISSRPLIAARRGSSPSA